MLLRSRITLLVALGFALLVAALGGSGLLRERLLQERLRDTAISAQSALWRELVEVETQQLDATLARLATWPQVTQALQQGDMEAASDSLRSAMHVSGDAEWVVLIGAERQGRLLYGEGTIESANGLLDAGALDRVLAGGRAGGLRQTGAKRLSVLAAVPVRAADGFAVLVAGRNARYALSRFAARTQSQAVLLTLRGDVAAATDSELWKRAGLAVSPRVASYAEAGVGDAVYRVTSVPVRDVADGAAGVLVTLDDVTASLAPSRWIGRAAGIGAALLVLLGLVGVNLYLWRSFQPLQSAIASLQALATPAPGAAPSTAAAPAPAADEISRIGQAVQAFRQNALALASSRAQRERVRRRQEIVIRRGLQNLADSIDLTSREELLALLDEPAAEAGSGEDEALRRLARVMGDLTLRIIGQHQRLSAMVVELREALVTKTKLAGLQQELQIASQVQLSILPRRLPDDPRIALHCHITPAREIGGDFYDYFRLDERHWGFVVADVSGKGVPAALFMAITRTLLKSSAIFEQSPVACVRRLNDLLAAENEQMLFVTLFYAVMNVETGQVRYVNAGHNPPYLLRASGALETVPRVGGLAVAVQEGFAYREGLMTLEPGDGLYLYTDGITEAFDAEGGEYGTARLEAVLRSAPADVAPEDLSRRVLQDVHAFESGAPQADDMTCMVLRYRSRYSPEATSSTMPDQASALGASPQTANPSTTANNNPA